MPQSVLRAAGALAIVAGLTMTAQQASAEQWVFHRIAQTGDTLPFDNNAVMNNLGGCAIENGNISFSGSAIKNAMTISFIAARINGINRTVVTSETPVPDGFGDFGFISSGHIDGECIVFTGEDSGRGDPATGVYRYHPAAKIHTIVDRNDLVPGSPGGAFMHFNGVFADNDIVAVPIEYDDGFTSLDGVLTFDDGARAIVLNEDSPLPDAESIDFFEGFDYRNGVIVSRIRTDSGPRGVYLFSDGGDSRIAGEGDLVPDGAIGEVFSGIASPAVVDQDGDRVAFYANGDMGTAGLFSKVSSSALELIVAEGDAAPPTFSHNFDNFIATPAIDNGAYVFLARTTEDADADLYTTLGDTVGNTPKLVLAVGDMLDGKTITSISAPGRQALSGHTLICCVEFEDGTDGVYTATLTQEMMETEPNNSMDTANCIEVLSNCVFVSGKLQSNEFPECDPDTVLVAFDKQVNFLEDDLGARFINDDDSPEGDGRASALWNVPLVPAGDGTSTIRLGVTGKGDVVEGMGGTNGDFNGLIQNAPHEQLGEFTLTITFVDDMDVALASPAMLPDGSFIENPFSFVEEFQSGGDAFFFNVVAPIGADSAHAVIDNTTGRIDACNDVDFFVFKNLIPGCPYCVTQVGGLNEQCTQTDGMLAWYQKTGDIIISDDNSGAGVYADLCDPDLPVVADINGEIHIAITGSGDLNFNGLIDGPDEDDYLAYYPEYANEYPGLPPMPAMVNSGGQTFTRAVDLVCADPPPAHGQCGCYTIKIMLDPVAHDDPVFNLTIDEAMQHADLNMDGRTDTADLGILLGSFGWVAP